MWHPHTVKPEKAETCLIAIGDGTDDSVYLYNGIVVWDAGLQTFVDEGTGHPCMFPEPWWWAREDEAVKGLKP